MTEHSLPSDPGSWPSDPYRLLGVDRNVSTRDLRKAYHRLIRLYKPEHAPEEFKRIRDAYESTLPSAQFRERFREQSSSTEDESETEQESNSDPHPHPYPHPDRSVEGTSWEIVIPRSDPPEVVESSTADRPPLPPDAWDLACRGEPEAAYRALVSLVERPATGRDREDSHLQLYWLLAVVPTLDPSRSPVDWLLRGVSDNGSGAGAVRLRELIRRAIAADSTLAIGDRLAGSLRRKTPPAVVLDILEARWRAARSARRWSLILADVQTLRNWLPEADEASWARVLLAAASHLAWAESPDSDHAVRFAREVEGLGDRHQDYADDLYQVEYVQIVKAGLDLLGGRTGGFSGIFQFLSISWDEQGPEFRARLRSYIDQIARDPRASLACLDQIHSVAPAVLGRLSTLIGGLDLEEYRFIAPEVYAEVTPVIQQFLKTTTWNQYDVFRPNLLRFCVREAVSPGLVARTLADRPEFILTGKNPLAHTIAGDLVLRHVFRACELIWEEPAPVRF